jgi:hypothetical protein
MIPACRINTYRSHLVSIKDNRNSSIRDGEDAGENEESEEKEKRLWGRMKREKGRSKVEEARLKNSAIFFIYIECAPGMTSYNNVN